MIRYDKTGDWQLINRDTGEVGTPEEIIEFAASVSGGAKNKRGNFSILYPLKFYGLIDAVGSKKMLVIEYIIKNMGADNVLIATSQEITDKIGVSKNTVDRTLQALTKANLIRRRPGIIMVNPQLINRKHRAGEIKLMLKFDSLERSDSKHERQNDSGADTPPEEQEPPK